MALISIKEFADKHHVTVQAVYERISKGELKETEKYGLILVNDKQKIKKFRKRKRKSA